MPSTSRATHNRNSSDTPKQRKDPSWDSSPLTKRKWVDGLEWWIPLMNSAYRKLIEYGVSQEKGVTVTVSIEHSLHLYKRNVIKGTFEKPSTPNQLKLIDESASLSDFEEEEDTATSTSPSTPAAPSKAPQRLPAPAGPGESDEQAEAQAALGRLRQLQAERSRCRYTRRGHVRRHHQHNSIGHPW